MPWRRRRYWRNCNQHAYMKKTSDKAINSIRLNNFKSFKDTQISFSKITLLTGANSSGKSSIINSLLSILQTEQFPFYLSPNGEYTDLGGYEDIVHLGNTKNKIEISISFNAGNYDYSSDFDTQEVQYTTTWEKNPINSLTALVSVEIKSNEINLSIKPSNELNKKYITNWKTIHFHHYLKRIKEDFDNINQIKNSKKKTINGNKISFNEAAFDSLESALKTTILNEEQPYFRFVREGIEKFTQTPKNKFNFIGSFRNPPNRTYYQKSKSNRVNSSGEGYIDQLIEWEEVKDKRLKEVIDILIELELAHNIKSNKLKGGRFELLLKTSKKGIHSSLSDVGFGISQFLPIIVADLQLGNSSLLAVSQPEIHLHPKVQANFANYLANQISKNKQYIIESHSEYLINRIRLLIVEGKLQTEDVNIYYLDKEENVSTVHEIKFEKDGRITGAPRSFFDTYMMDVMNIALAATE